MASERQIAANRRNATLSTGPRTTAGKARSRRNAVRHGLTAATVIPSLENRTDYEALQQELIGDFCPINVIEHELVARLASLLWRLRRVTRIETGLFEMHQRVGEAQETPTLAPHAGMEIFYDLLRPMHAQASVPQRRGSAAACETGGKLGSSEPAPVADAYLALIRQSGNAFKRLSRYEMSLWRQVAQTLLILQSGTLLTARGYAKRLSIQTS